MGADCAAHHPTCAAGLGVAALQGRGSATAWQGKGLLPGSCQLPVAASSCKDAASGYLSDLAPGCILLQYLLTNGDH